MSRPAIFLAWFVAGAALVFLNTPFVLGALPMAHLVLGVLTAPGAVLSLPVHNLVASPWWVVGAIGLANGLSYGLAALGIASLRRHRRAGGSR